MDLHTLWQHSLYRELQNVERNRTSRFRNMQSQFDNRRTDMEMRMQEAQLEQELRWMETNPGKMPPSWGVQGGSQSMVSQYDNQLIAHPPQHNAEIEQPINLGIVEEEEPKKKK